MSKGIAGAPNTAVISAAPHSGLVNDLSERRIFPMD